MEVVDTGADGVQNRLLQNMAPRPRRKPPPLPHLVRQNFHVRDSSPTPSGKEQAYS